MEKKRNLVGHFQSTASNSDKIYMACVRHNTDGTWTVIGKYGRRDRRFQQQVKLTTDSESKAMQEQRALFQAKEKKGYRDIDDPSYVGPVDRGTKCVRDNLEDETVQVVPKKVPKVKPVPSPEPEPDELVCKDNAGMEDLFDTGITYVVEPHKEEGLIWVYDRYGEKTACMRDRFMTEKEFEAGCV
jgi:predicted DNA-binding WGR domain protein